MFVKTGSRPNTKRAGGGFTEALRPRAVMEPPPPLEDLLKEPKPQDAPPQDLKGLVPNKGSEARDHCVRAGHHFERFAF